MAWLLMAARWHASPCQALFSDTPTSWAQTNLHSKSTPALTSCMHLGKSFLTRGLSFQGHRILSFLSCLHPGCPEEILGWEGL